MPTPRIRRRSDGLVEIRRRRALDVLVTPDTVILLAMLAGFIVLCATLVLELVTSPILVAMTGGFLLLGAWGGALAKPRRLSNAPIEPPPHRVA